MALPPENSAQACRELGQRVARLEGEFAAAQARRLRDDQQLDDKFETVDKFRDALSDLSKLMMTRTEFDARHGQTEATIKNLDTKIDAARAARDASMAREFEAVNKQIAFNTTRLDRLEGASKGLGTLAGWVIAILGTFVTAAVTWLVYEHTK